MYAFTHTCSQQCSIAGTASVGPHLCICCSLVVLLTWVNLGVNTWDFGTRCGMSHKPEIQSDSEFQFVTYGRPFLGNITRWVGVDQHCYVLKEKLVTLITDEHAWMMKRHGLEISINQNIKWRNHHMSCLAMHYAAGHAAYAARLRQMIW